MLGFTKNEIKVFENITYNPQSVADIVRKTKMPRMTVYTILLRFQKNSIAKTSLVHGGKKLLWEKSKTTLLEKHITKTRDSLLGDSPQDKKVASLGASGITFFSGKEEVSSALMSLITKKDGIKMYSIQSSKNFPKWLQLFGKDWNNLANQAIIKHKLICFTVYTSDVPKEIIEDKEVIGAYKGRLGNSHTIPESFIKKDTAFYIFEDTIFLCNLEKIEAIMFINEEMASFLVKMFSFVFEKTEEDSFFLQYGRDSY